MFEGDLRIPSFGIFLLMLGSDTGQLFARNKYLITMEHALRLIGVIESSSVLFLLFTLCIEDFGVPSCEVHA